jgi:hypothetical protein
MLTTPVQRILGTRTRGTRLSSSPSKIPYGEFSPVWLQTGIPRRPSPTRSGSSRHPAPAYYTRLKSLSRKRATSRSGTFVQTALSPSDRTLPSRGPWLASGFCCPAGWTLTMTSSETLGSSRPTSGFAGRSNLGREVPQFTLPVCFLRTVFCTPADRTTATGCSLGVSLRQDLSLKPKFRARNVERPAYGKENSTFPPVFVRLFLDALHACRRLPSEPYSARHRRPVG